MPIYEYSCMKCGNRFEKLLKSADVESESVECPSCGSAEVKKELSTFSSGGAKPPACDCGGACKR
ncbi:MAG: zinc ribbon domain-containing protein [Desulfuromonadaceae bacterium]|nr:zinc ribbon domain-containing protein [Desulfuromonadaceae bacterium]MDD5104416.1 zinc ribbon domain-containing protein [Desulfuromonadaceae bacterium]